jgi:hypothetical protein
MIDRDHDHEDGRRNIASSSTSSSSTTTTMMMMMSTNKLSPYLTHQDTIQYHTQ